MGSGSQRVNGRTTVDQRLGARGMHGNPNITEKGTLCIVPDPRHQDKCPGSGTEWQTIPSGTLQHR
eukprot:4284713-Prorocentrum_lima.AAC.1